MTLLLSLIWVGGAFSQSEVGVGAQVTSESAVESGKSYILQSQASGNPYIVDAGTYYSLPNSGNTATEASVYQLISNGDGTWKIKSAYTGKYWGVPIYGQDLVPSSELSAGAWSLNFNSGIAYPTAPDADGVVRGLDRSSQHLWGYTTGTGGTKQVKIYELSGKPISSVALEELTGKVISVAANPANDLTTNQWYVMFDRGTQPKNHGYLYEAVSSHTLYNTATVPSGLATAAARFLVRLSDAGDGKYYVQTGFGNYFGAISHKVNVPVTALPEEAQVIEKIAGSDGHFYIQSSTTNVVLDANDVGSGDATVVGWNTTVPTTTGGNNDWAFYPVTLEDIDPSIAVFEGDVKVTRGYQTCGRGNENTLLLRVDMDISQNVSDAAFTVKLNNPAQASISSLYAYKTTSTEFLANIPSSTLGSTSEISNTATINIGNVAAGSHHFWICATIKEDAELEAILTTALKEFSYSCNGSEQALDLTNVGNPSRQGVKVFAQQNFLFKPTTDNCRFYRIPAMTLDADGNIVVAIDKRYNSNADLGNHKIDVISMRSEDGGRTWTDKATVAIGDGQSAAYFGYGDAALARAANGDLVCIMASGNKTWGYGMNTAGFAKSTDNGKSWTLTRNLFSSTKFYDENSSNGKLSVNNLFTSSGKGLTTNDGVIMFTTNCCESRSSTYYNYILYSTDNGETWRLSNKVAYSGTDESKLEQLNDGSLLLSVRQSGNRGWNTATYTKNADGTVTFKWGKQYQTSDIWGNACNADILYYSRSTEGKDNIMLHSYINSSGRESLQLSMSIDGGKSWKSAYNIQPNGSCYSTMVALPSGDVALLYEDESYSAGNGYAINYVTITQEQIIKWYEAISGKTSDIDFFPLRPATNGAETVYTLQGIPLAKMPSQKGIYVQKGRKFVVR